MARAAFWDSVLVIDGEISDDLIDQARGLKPSDLEEGAIEGTDPHETSYKTKNNIDAGFLYNSIDFLGVIPKLDDHEVTWVSNFHSFNAGDRMTLHCDSKYSIAMTVYLTECVGGELQICKGDDYSQSVVLSPLPNRLIIMKCENQHRVLEVTDGTRDAIQFFITYTKSGE